MIAETPKPPYYAVIFTTLRTENNEGYKDMSDRMVELARKQEGFLGIESARDGLGITVSYWQDLDAIKSWKHNLEHTAAREEGRKKWYAEYKLRIAKVDHDYDFARD